jgi:hypothetical protein
MATSAYGAAADHAALSGLTSGDPHTQYANTGQGTAALRPVQPVRAGYYYWASDEQNLYRSDGANWFLITEQPAKFTFARAFLSATR